MDDEAKSGRPSHSEAEPTWRGVLVDYIEEPAAADPRHQARLAPADPAELRHSKRRLAERANRGEQATLAIPPLKCRGHCGRRIAKLLTDPRPEELTPDGHIEASWSIVGPELSIFGPVDMIDGVFHLRRRESPAAPEAHVGLRGRTEPIVIVCSCGYRNVLDERALTAAADARRV